MKSKKPDTNKCKCGCGNHKKYHFRLMLDMKLKDLIPNLKQDRLWECCLTDDIMCSMPDGMLNIILERGLISFERKFYPRKCPVIHRGCCNYKSK